MKTPNQKREERNIHAINKADETISKPIAGANKQILKAVLKNGVESVKESEAVLKAEDARRTYY
jgi:thiamine monophosphate synthase